MSDSNHLYDYLLMLGDNSLILGHRLSEMCGHGPTLETDIALTNISLDLFGEVRNHFQYAAEVAGGETTEDSIAFLRYVRQYRNVLMVEQPNEDYAHIIVRQFLFDAYHLPLLTQLQESKDERIAAIAAKSVKESRYHLAFSSEWMKRLGDGTDVSREKLQIAVDHLYPFAAELFNETETERVMREQGIGADLALVKAEFDAKVKEVMADARMEDAEIPPRPAEGKVGKHTEHLGYILADLQYMQRAYPDMKW